MKYLFSADEVIAAVAKVFLTVAPDQMIKATWYLEGLAAHVRSLEIELGPITDEAKIVSIKPVSQANAVCDCKEGQNAAS